MPRSLRSVALAAVLALAALWLAPALVGPIIAARVAEGAGASLAFEGVRPEWPWGVSAERTVVAVGGRIIEFSQLRARMRLSGGRVEARVGEGTLLLRTDGLTLRGGFLRAQAFPLDLLEGLVSSAFALRGAADGVYRFGARETLEATVSRGAAVLHAPLAIELPFAQLIVAAEREADGGWRVDFANLSGPPLSCSAQGRIGAAGELALRVEISQLEEPARFAFAAAALPTGPLPYSAELTGTLAQPRFSPAGLARR